ncbi:MAG: ATP-binding protein [Actinomycetota bacterium]|jgi:hypothetical protein|nr:ATP-binding protein [Actinomycetota bacterium]
MARPAHEVTTRHLGAAYPFVAAGSLGTAGVLVGRDLCGGAFVHDPFELYQRQVVTNPNMIIFGQIGRGKSALVKTYLWRQAVFGRRAWVVDPKGEYGQLAAHWGVTPVALRPGGTLRLNPLDAPSRAGMAPGGTAGDSSGSGGEDELVRRRGELLCALIEACLVRRLLPSERVAVELAVQSVSYRRVTPTLPDVVAAMLAPAASAAAAVRTDPATLAADGRQGALELRRLVAGDLRGMFDGPTSPGLDPGGPLVVLDLSALYQSAALGVVMTCATAWLHAQLAGRGGGSDSMSSGVLVVVDEAWALLGNLGVARWLQSSWKLARAWGVANIAVLHRVSDLAAGAESGSAHRELAHGLLADSETRVVYGQAPGEVTQARRMLGLSSTEAELVPHLGRGVALWRVGDRSFLVRHVVGPAEAALVWTDKAMAAAQ